jgi:hypothetical protein
MSIKKLPPEACELLGFKELMEELISYFLLITVDLGKFEVCTLESARYSSDLC